jgi:hypothetical protein
MKKVLFFFFLFVFGSKTSIAMSNESRLLAECEFIYAYAGQLLQIQNNIGGAVSALRRSSIMSAANFISSADGGVVSESLIQTWTALRPPLKRRFDNKLSDPIVEATRCDRIAMPIAIKVRDSKKKFRDKDFDELQGIFFQDHRTSLGI